VHPKDRFVVIPPNSPHSVQPLSTIPDFYTDLNAVHELEKLLTEKGVNAWWEYVNRINRLNPTPFGRETAVHATAAQRAEAIGLTLNLWKQ
jgi:hypothetical protein